MGHWPILRAHHHFGLGLTLESMIGTHSVLLFGHVIAKLLAFKEWLYLLWQILPNNGKYNFLLQNTGKYDF